ncbi:MAG: hypothetical protein ACLR7Z_09630 [Bilophila wadsworthia]
MRAASCSSPAATPYEWLTPGSAGGKPMPASWNTIAAANKDFAVAPFPL